MKYILFIALSVWVSSCKKKTDTTFQNLPQVIQTKIAEAQNNCPGCGLTLVSYTYKGDVIYGSTCNGPTCDCITIFYDQKGELIQYNKETYFDLNASGVLVKEVFRCGA